MMIRKTTRNVSEEIMDILRAADCDNRLRIK